MRMASDEITVMEWKKTKLKTKKKQNVNNIWWTGEVFHSLVCTAAALSQPQNTKC